MPKKTICLNMIVKNESHIIQETLDNISKYIDYWVICDTGSTDGTQDLIKEYFRKRGIPGDLVQHQWKNFGYNRSLALKECKGKADYIFVIDADDLIVGDLTLPNNMNADVYKLVYGTGFTYHREQIFGNHLEWRYVGVLHEYPECTNKKNTNSKLIEGNYYVDSRRLGARNKDPKKYLKDAEVLVQGIEDVLKEGDKDLAARYAFYAGQSYKDYSDRENSNKYYRMRIQMGGWFEETYYSYYQVAKNLQEMGKSDEEVEKAYLEAYNFLKVRSEPLYELAAMYRLKGNFEKSYHFGCMALKIPFPKDLGLFISKDVYDWKTKDECSISAYYLKKYQPSFDMCQQLLHEGYLPEDQRHRVEANRDYCVPFIKEDLIKYNSELVKKITNNVSKKKRNLVTYTVTTCKRFDLFQKTINSFINCCTDILQIDKWICVDDNSSAEDRKKMETLYPFFQFVWKTAEQKGHPESMNIIIDMVKSPFVLHMEDDWQFFEKKEYIKPALEILQEDKTLGQVCFNRNYAEVLKDRESPGGLLRWTKDNHIRYLIHEHYHPDSQEYKDFGTRHNNRPSSCYWPHYSLRPSVINTKVFKDVGRYNTNTTHFEMEYSHRYFALNYKTAFYDAISCLHIGRLTSERDDKTKKNAYELNSESQFGERKKQLTDTSVTNTSITGKTEKKVSFKDDITNQGIMTKETETTKGEKETAKEFVIDYDSILIEAQKGMIKNMPFGMNTINEPPAVKSAITDIITNDNIENKNLTRPTPRTPKADYVNDKGKEFEGYKFCPSKDSMGNDIKHVGDKTVEELKAICDEDPNCVAFNTLGYFKHTIVDESEYISLPSYDGKLHGMYINMKHLQNMLDSVRDRILGKKEPSIAFVIKYDDGNMAKFKNMMNQFMFKCRDIEIISTWICINMDVDCEAEVTIKEAYPFMQYIVSDPDISEILKLTKTKYILTMDNDIARRHFNIRDGINKLNGSPHINKIYFNEIGLNVDDPTNKGPYLTMTTS